MFIATCFGALAPGQRICMTRDTAAPRDEAAQAALGELFESRGFRRASPPRFEDYSLFADNKSFFRGDSVVSFMGPDGKLLAVKPDITLSIAKGITAGTLISPEKLYYCDEVCRMTRDSGEYRFIRQTGLEIIGPSDPYSGLEALDMALRSLALLGGEFVLDISHLAYISAMTDELGINNGAREQLMAALHAKSPHRVRALLQAAGADAALTERAAGIAAVSGPLDIALPRARELACGNDAMLAALDELAPVSSLALPRGGQMNLDFSVVGDLDYYNGLVFLGYISGAPGAVLSGGRYDGLMDKMGKSSRAVGFAISLSQLARDKSGEKSADVLAVYEPGCDFSLVLKKAAELTAQGLAVRLEPSGGEGVWRGGRTIRFTPGGEVEEGEL